MKVKIIDILNNVENLRTLAKTNFNGKIALKVANKIKEVTHATEGFEMLRKEKMEKFQSSTSEEEKREIIDVMNEAAAEEIEISDPVTITVNESINLSPEVILSLSIFFDFK